jgi:membrane-bound lytic murein transglycosylase F
LDAVRASGKLVVVTRNAPTTYFQGPDGPGGVEYDMVRGLADSLNVDLELRIVNDVSEIAPMVARGHAHLAAGLSITEARQQLVRFGQPYQRVHAQVVYRLGTEPPRNVSELAGRQIEVAHGSSYAERLRVLVREHPGLRWSEVKHESTEELLQLVWDGLLELTIADSNIVAIVRQYYPELRVAFSLDQPQALAWAFPKSDDTTLYNFATRYLDKLRHSGELAHIVERYYGPSNRFDYVNLSVYQARIRSRLRTYESLFQQTSARHGLDWRLLAAVGYQESHWDSQAVSPTGVRGLMMLTQATAVQLGVVDRLDAAQSVEGGARYLRHLLERIPQHIPMPDRQWMALAAYNVGFHHLEDARIITQRRGGNPDKWNDVKNSLPLLAKPAWYSKTRYGYARGVEPVRFVTRVRIYYDVLVNKVAEPKLQARTELLSFSAPAI